MAAGLVPEAVGDIFNIGTDRETTILELAQTMLKITGAKSILQFVPQEKIYGTSYEDIPRRVPDNTRMKAVLKVNCDVSLEDGLRKTIGVVPESAFLICPKLPFQNTLQLALKIDVDTYRGIKEGASNLVSLLLHSQRIPASFFVSLGPDNSGWAATASFPSSRISQKNEENERFVGVRMEDGAVWDPFPCPADGNVLPNVASAMAGFGI